ncbi:MAG TPA: YncE family protein [Bacteroidia bacterium]|nr:YncE family protein [Bacteroidia bacterium]
MKRKDVKSAIWVIAIVLMAYASCKKDKKETPPVSDNITYNAAYVVNGGSNSISVIDLSTNEVKRTINLSNVMWPHHVYLNSAKTQIAIGVPGMDLSGGHNVNTTGMTGKFLVLGAVTASVVKTQDLPMMNHNAIFSPDGNEIWTSQMDTMGTVHVYDANTYALKNTINVGMMPAEVTFSADGSMAFVANSMSDDVTAINASTKAVMTTIPVGMGPVGAWAGSNNKMYVDNEEGQSISVIDAPSMSVEETVPLGFMPGMAAYNSAMNELWVSDPDNGKVHYWTRIGSTWTHGGEFATGAGAHAIAFNSMTAYITNQLASTVSVADIMAHAVSKTITVGTKPNGITLKK